MKGPAALFQGDIITKYEKSLTKLKKIILQNHCAISTKFGTKHQWIKEIQLNSNEGSQYFLRRDNNKTTLITFWKLSSPEPLGQFQLNLVHTNLRWRKLMFKQMKTFCQREINVIFFSRTSGPVLTKLGINYFWGEEVKLV